LETLAVSWNAIPLSAEDLANELTLIETSFLNPPKEGSPLNASEGNCLTIVATQFDDRLNDYTRSQIEGLVGFGADDACPKLRELLLLSNRLQTLMNETTKEIPKCRDLLEWHLLHYSCSGLGR
jgi:hypothetical protein